jgi:predicted secreted Zn-dependent protease
MRTYAVINISDLELIDFSQIEETSSNTIRKSIDNTQFVIKWQEGYEPTFITDGTVIPVGIYTHSEILELMATDKWSEPII